MHRSAKRILPGIMLKLGRAPAGPAKAKDVQSRASGVGKRPGPDHNLHGMNAIAVASDRETATKRTEIRHSVRPAMPGRQRFLNACSCLPVDRPPIWLMRQAGRALPEYRKLKERYSFLDLVRTPDLAAEVTLQPIRRFGFDAAIIFSDILVIPETMGVGYRFRESGGVEMDFAIKTAADIEKLSVKDVVQKLSYVTDAIKLVRGALGNKTALLGFAGSPWTLANFMLDGGSAKEHTGA